VFARGNVLRLTCAFFFSGDTKEVVTASLDKSLALWRLQVHFQKSLATSLQLVVDLTPAAWLVLWCRLLTFTFIGIALQDASLPDATPSTSGVSEVVRLSPDVAPIFMVADSHALGDSHNQVFCGNLAKSVVAWEPPDSHLIPKVHLNSHTGWVRGLATSRRWLFR